MRPLTWMRAVRDSDLPRDLKTTAWALGLRSGKDGRCWPSYETLAKDCGADRRDVIRRVSKLCEAGWIAKFERVNGHGHQSNLYLLTTPGGSDISPTPLVTPHPLGSDISPTPQGVTSHPPRRGREIEVSTTGDDTPVDSALIVAMLNGMANHHRIP